MEPFNMTDEEYWREWENLYDKEIDHDIDIIERKIKHDIEMEIWPNIWLVLFIISLIGFVCSLITIIQK